LICWSSMSPLPESVATTLKPPSMHSLPKRSRVVTTNVAGLSVSACAMPSPAAVDFCASGFAGLTVMANGEFEVARLLRRVRDVVRAVLLVDNGRRGHVAQLGADLLTAVGLDVAARVARLHHKVARLARNDRRRRRRRALLRKRLARLDERRKRRVLDVLALAQHIEPGLATMYVHAYVPSLLSLIVTFTSPRPESSDP